MTDEEEIEEEIEETGEEEIEEVPKELTQTERITDLWDRFVDSIDEANKIWKELNDLFENDRPENYPDLPMKVQKGLAMFRRMKFVVMMPRFINYYVQSGGMEAIKSNIKKEGD